jgi:hypothetical protein
MAAERPRVVLGGEVGAAATTCAARFHFAPFDSLPWLRADLAGETASEFDDAGWGNVLFRPFKNYSGDISGRFIEIMAMDSHGDHAVHPAFKSLLEGVPEQQPFMEWLFINHPSAQRVCVDLAFFLYAEQATGTKRNDSPGSAWEQAVQSKSFITDPAPES